MPADAPVSTRSDPPCNCGTLRKASRRISQLYDDVLEPSGLKLSQYQLLSHIQRAGDPPTMGELAAALVLDRSALAHNLKPLERDGFVEQIPNALDGRSRRAALTPLGRRKFVECRRLWRKAQQRFEAVYGLERSIVLADALSTLVSDDFSDAFATTERLRETEPPRFGEPKSQPKTARRP